MVVRNGADESVASARHGFDEAGLVRGILQRLAQAVDRFIQALIEIDKGVGWPQLLHQLVASNQLAGAIEQCGEDVKRLFLNSDRCPLERSSRVCRSSLTLQNARTIRIRREFASRLTPISCAENGGIV